MPTSWAQLNFKHRFECTFILNRLSFLVVRAWNVFSEVDASCKESLDAKELPNLAFFLHGKMLEQKDEEKLCGMLVGSNSNSCISQTSWVEAVMRA